MDGDSGDRGDGGDRGAGLHVTVLGAVRATHGGEAATVPGARLRGLLVRLALAGGRTVGPDALVDAIWPEDPPAAPAHALQALVSRLRRALGSPGAVERAAGGYRLRVTEADVDALRFDRLATVGRDRLRAADPGAAASALAAAVALWDGGSPGAEPAAVAEVAPTAATRLAHTAVEAVADLAEAELALGREDEAAVRLRALLADHPLHERAAALTMDALAAQGRQAEALALYERIRAALAGTLGTDPGAALRARHLRLLRAEGGEPGRDDGAGTADRDGGSGGATSPLPEPLTSFVGRDDDLARIEGLFGEGRLVTVVGPGGAGKTRLAIEAARRRHRRHPDRDGVVMVDLAPVTEPAKAGEALLAALGPQPDGSTGVRAGARRRPSADDPVDQLTARLAHRDTLVLLDNCEHLVDAVAHLVAALLPRCAGLRVLATSREPLAVDGEALVPLGPLTLPEPDDAPGRARQTAAVRLFTARTAAVRPGFTADEASLPAVVRVVRALDGMPLALELAAARLRTLSLPALADGLGDRFRLLTGGSRTAPHRHRTLRAVIAWSWDLLSAPERTLAERVAVLPGGITPESAAALSAGTGVPSDEVPELLAALVDRSLLQLAPEPGRYRMLETLREYGIERLAAAGALGTARDLAAAHFAALVARNDPSLRGPGQRAALRALEADHDNTLAALRHRTDTGDGPGALALALSLAWYWQLRGRAPEAAHWLGAALAVPGAGPAPAQDCARALQLLSRTADGGGPAAEAEETEHEIRTLTDRLLDVLRRSPAGPSPLPAGALAGLTALPLAFRREGAAMPALVTYLAEGDEAWAASTTRFFRAQSAENAGEFEAARADVEHALTGLRRTGDDRGRADVLMTRAQFRQYDGDLDGALDDLREAGTLTAAAHGEAPAPGPVDQVFGALRRIDLRLRRGETEAALEMTAWAREQASRSRTPGLTSLVDVWEALLRLREGDHDRARALLDAAEHGLSGTVPFPGDHARTLTGCVRAALCLETGEHEGARRALGAAYGAGLATGDLPLLAQVTVGTAALADALGHPRRAAYLLGAATRLRGAHDRSDPQVRALAGRLRSALGEGDFAAAHARGRALDRRTAAAETDPESSPFTRG